MHDDVRVGGGDSGVVVGMGAGDDLGSDQDNMVCDVAVKTGTYSLRIYCYKIFA